MNGLPYYKAYPRDFIEGTIGMDFEMKAAYRLILDLIYMQGGALPDDARYISGLIGCSVKKWNSLRGKLIDAGKIEVRDGYLGNLRADKELETLGKLQDKQRENRARPNKNNNLQSPRSDHTDTDTDKEIPDTNVSGRDDASEPDPDDDFSKQVFDRAIAFLGKHGTSERQARSFVGKLRKGGASDTEIFEAFMAASRERIVDPIPWITARMKPKAANSPAITDNVLRLVAEAFEAEDKRKAAK